LNNGNYISGYGFSCQIVDNLKGGGEILVVKKIKPIKTFEFNGWT
jgi:hypothetical protein